ncbi:site-specific DNA-methyltransferase [Streptococcus uberis]|uniref:site-specific DNA-methyltransferase n=1 Tax=Streptococcus uberis TaxID=1349 RepID=UPI003D6ADE4F
MEIVKVGIDTIEEYEKNAKLHPKEQIEQIKKSIEEFGNNDPIAIDENNIIIEGHGRYKALKELGYKEVEVIKLTHLSEEQKKAYILAHNKLTMNTDFDIDLLNDELADIIDIDMSDFGFEMSFDDEEDEVVEDEFDDTPPEEPTAKLGDIYQLGRHRLMCGDSTSVEDVEKLMDGMQADMLLTDPPYNVAYEGKTKDALTIQNDSMDNDSFRQFLRMAFFAADNVMKPGAVFYIWHADSEGYNFRGACFDIGWTVRQCLIWNKNTMVLGRQDYHWKHEPCLYGWKEGAGHLWASDRKQTTIIDFDKPQRNGEHPTMKPVGLFDYQILNNTKGGDIVLDLFGGSGTTIMACEQNGRNGYLMELDPRYVDVIIRRWEEFTGETAVKLN